MTPEFLNFIHEIPDAILICDEQGKIIAVNIALENLFQYAQQDIKGQQVEILVPVETHKVHIEHRKSYYKQPKIRPMGLGIELQGQKQDGTVFPVQISLKPLHEENRLCVLAIIRDMSDYQKLEKQLFDSEKKLRIALESKLDQTEKKLIEAENMASLGGMVAGMTHEINTPIGVSLLSVSTALDTLIRLESHFKESQLSKSFLKCFINESTEALNIALVNLNRAVDLIKSFKSVAIDQASGDQRLFNVRDYIDEIILSLRPKLKKTSHQIIILCPNELVINSFPGAFAQILVNFVENSLIHGFENTSSGIITITASVKQNILQFCYQDNGCGVAENLVDKIFEPFTTSKREKGCSGLGMNIVYSLVTNVLSGDVHCASTLGQGVTFNIEIPL